MAQARKRRKRNAKNLDATAWHQRLITDQRYKGRSSIKNRLIRSFPELALSETLVMSWHPRLLVEELVARRGTQLVFTYSRYEVAEPGLQGAARRSVVFQVPACEVTQQWLAARFAELSPNEEMAWHSVVELQSRRFHIPMIDFIGQPEYENLRDLGRRLAGTLGLQDRFVVFETGRSLHGYFPDLIPDEALPKYLGQLLLLNEHDCPPVIDTRWVGHALMRGFTALRWSHNTSRYRALPRRSSVLNFGSV